MARMGTVPQVVLDELRDAYVDMMDKKARVAREVRERYRDKIAEETERETRVLERAFGVQMVEVREMGATRKELVKVIGDGTSGVYRKFIELGGGTIAGRKTGADRLAERAEDIGVSQVAENLFDLIVGKTADGLGELAIPVEIQYKDGKPFIWPVDPSDVVVLRDTYGYDRAALYNKGAEIVAAFGLEED